MSDKGQRFIELVVAAGRLEDLWEVERPYADLDADLEIAEKRVRKAAIAYVETLGDLVLDGEADY